MCELQPNKLDNQDATQNLSDGAEDTLLAPRGKLCSVFGDPNVLVEAEQTVNCIY